MKIIYIYIVLIFNLNVFAQLTVDNSQTPQQLVQNILAGAGVNISNITFNGSPLAIGSFNGANSNVGFSSGIILSSGDITNAIGPNNYGGTSSSVETTGDIDIDVLISPSLSFDAAVLEFDFVPVSDTVVFNYVFGSEEYLEYVGLINDAFGFFISGPGIMGPYSNNSKNIAIIPNTNSFVSIANVNDVMNSQFYIDNGNGSTPPFNTSNYYIEYDGLTTPLQAVSEVQCGQTYHLKIVIADAADGILDSGVFLEAGSLSSTDINFNFASLDGSTIFYENCSSPQLFFSRPSDQVNNALTLNIDISGTATGGTDYTSIPNTITFNVGQDTVFVPFQVFSDDLSENDETITITANVLTDCGNTIQITKSVTIKDPIKINSISSMPTLSCENSGSVQASVTNNVGTIHYSWNGPGVNGSIVGNTTSVQNLSGGWYFLHIEDDVCEAIDSVFVDELAPPIANLSVGNTIGAIPLTVVF